MNLRNTRCPICNNRNIIDLLCKNNYFFCQNCHTAFAKKILTKKYREEYYFGNSRIASNLFAPIENFFYSHRNRFINNPPKLWVDVGAGDGNYLQAVCAKEKIGVEISTNGRLLIKNKRIKAITSDQFLKSKKLDADVISFWHSLEHIKNPKIYLSAAFKNLKKNGKLIIAIPNIDSLEFSFFKENWFHLAPSFHIWHFSPISISFLLNNCGFSIEKIDYFSFEHHFAGLLQSMINQTSGSFNVLHSLFKRKSKLSVISLKDIFWCFFWLTIGLPILFLFFFIAVIAKRSGTVVVLAIKK